MERPAPRDGESGSRDSGFDQACTEGTSRGRDDYVRKTSLRGSPSRVLPAALENHDVSPGGQPRSSAHAARPAGPGESGELEAACRDPETMSGDGLNGWRQELGPSARGMIRLEPSREGAPGGRNRAKCDPKTIRRRCDPTAASRSAHIEWATDPLLPRRNLLHPPKTPSPPSSP